MRSNLVRASALTSLILAPAAAAANPVAATPVTITYQCQATPPLSAPQTLTMSLGVSATAPSTANAGDSVAITLAPAAMQVPGTVSGHTLDNIRGVQLTLPVPTDSTYVSGTLTGGTVSATITRSGGTITVSAPDAVAGGTAFTLPAAAIDVTATAAGTITSTVGGTSYSDPGLTFTASVESGTILGAVDVPVACYPSPAPTLTTTTVTTANPGGGTGGGSGSSGSSLLSNLPLLGSLSGATKS
ncbi:hypothetical protein [Nocardia stercoris]|uniref:Cyclase n=1 Tax=Nocardia stercoris TaxID=2483361 RepID=A0A3M2KS51_9NOCA|nr:hypothetical protein [Nocardia stercoris]RMI27824.1 hypothetical protein EBN03_32795 [Nocardia stercoris]